MVGNYKTVPLNYLIKAFNQSGVSLDKLRETLFTFKCEKNHDEEDFLHNKAIKFESTNKARTFLLLDGNKIAAYFSLAFKSIDLAEVSKQRIKEITAGESNVVTYSAYLIGHIAKSDDIHNKIGYEILDEASSLITVAQKYVGGRLVYIDCKDEVKLSEFYENYGFKYFKTSEQTGLNQYYKKI
ncbi:MAG: hypothetical protein NC131_21220 [Roseburia sp.]|nr:hypothetical protein [Roseburia sp.]